MAGPREQALAQLEAGAKKVMEIEAEKPVEVKEPVKRTRKPRKKAD